MTFMLDQGRQRSFQFVAKKFENDDNFQKLKSGIKKLEEPGSETKGQSKQDKDKTKHVSKRC